MTCLVVYHVVDSTWIVRAQPSPRLSAQETAFLFLIKSVQIPYHILARPRFELDLQ